MAMTSGPQRQPHLALACWHVAFAVLALLVTVVTTAAEQRRDEAPARRSLDCYPLGMTWLSGRSPESRLCFKSTVHIGDIDTVLFYAEPLPFPAKWITTTLRARSGEEDYFRIVPLDTDMQIIIEASACGGVCGMQWRWLVEPLRVGQLVLQLEASGLDEFQQRVISYPRELGLTVETHPRRTVVGFLRANWQWLWAALLVPMITFAWRKTRARKGRKHRGS
jgi:hypothetical protein